LRLYLAIAAALPALAHDPATTKLTWSREISRIVYKHCAGCHDGRAAMSLLEYEQARPWAKAIRDEVLHRRMPPWGAIKGFGEFADDQSLTQEEITRIAEWVEGGAPEGDPWYLPAAPRVGNPTPPPRAVRFRGRSSPRALVVLAIRPLDDAVDAKIMAQRPDGIIDPLLWLRGYKRKWNRVFVYREPLRLPAGTLLVAEPETRFELLVRY
jgi:hypothetical protein